MVRRLEGPTSIGDFADADADDESSDDESSGTSGYELVNWSGGEL